MLVLCFNLLSFGGRELSSKYLQHSGRARVFCGRLEFSVVRVPSERARCCSSCICPTQTSSHRSSRLLLCNDAARGCACEPREAHSETALPLKLSGACFCLFLFLAENKDDKKHRIAFLCIYTISCIYKQCLRLYAYSILYNMLYIIQPVCTLEPSPVLKRKL